MSLAVKTPLSIGETLDRGFQLFRATFLRLLPLSLITAVLAAIPNGVRILEHRMASNKFSAEDALILLIVYLIQPLLLIAKVRLLDDALENRNQLSPWQALASSAGPLGRMIGAGLCYGLAVMVGFLLLVIPGIYLSVSLWLFAFFVIIENAGAIDALQRSRELVRGFWWRVATIGTVAFTILIAIGAGLGGLLGLLIPVLGVAQKMGQTPADAMLLATAMIAVLITGISALISPLAYAIGLITFRDLQLRKSGDDLAARIEQTA